MNIVFDIFTIIISIVLLVSNLHRIRDGSKYIIYYMFWVIYVLPLLLDYIVGEPIYSSLSSPGRMFGFIVSAQDELTRILYDVFLLLTQILLLNWKVKFTFGRRNSVDYTDRDSEQILFSRREMNIVSLLALVTPLLCLFTGRFWIAYTFGWRELGLGQGVLEQGNYSFFEKLSYLGVTASAFMLFWKNEDERNATKTIRNIFAVILLYSNICIEGKRSIIFFALIMCFMVQLYFDRGKFAILKMIVSLGIIITVVFVTSIFVKTQFRGYSSFENLYTTFRIDLFRDDTVKMVIYSFLHKEMEPLLNWPFQSYITQLYSIFPLDFLSGFGIVKLPRIGFNVYLSSALSRQSIESGINFMTTSLADELIANFHIFGFFMVGPILAIFSSFIDKQSQFEKILMIGAVVLLMIYSLNYIAYYLEAAFIVHLFLKRRRRYREQV